ncbi:MAG: extracellular solute-binding protein [Anaerovoracaceae bacterium]
MKKLYSWAVLLFLYAPILVLIVFSFNESKSRSNFTGFSLKWYIKLLHNETIMNAFVTTLIVAFVSAILATVFGSLAAIGINNMRKRNSQIIMGFTLIPIVSPEIVMGVSLMLLFTMFKIKFALTTLIIAHITFNLPYVILSVMPKLRQLDKNLIEAAMDLGCTPWKAFTKVLIPEIMPGILTGFVIALTFSLDDFNVSYFVSGDKTQTLPVLIYAMVRKRISPEINALSTIIFVIVLIVLIIANTKDFKKSFGIAGKNSRNLALLAIVVITGMSSFFLTMDKANGASFDKDYYSRFAGQGKSISVYNWGEYLSDGSDGGYNIVKEFEKLTGIKVYYTNFATNEELYAKLKKGSVNYDVIFPSDYMVARMIEEDMLLPLDKENIPNINLIDHRFADPDYDKGAKYSVPYAWNIVGILYNEKYIKEAPTSWDALWDKKYKDKMLMFSNSRDAFGITCKKLGYSLNTENDKELREATLELKRQKPLVQAYVMDQIFDKMENEEAIIAPYYSGDASLMMEYNENINVAFPKEGTNVFVDAAAIPSNSQEKEASEMFINFLNEPKVARDNIEFIGYSTPNKAAYEILPEEIKNNKIIYPEDDIVDNSEQFINLSERTNLNIDKYWVEVMASNKSFVSWGLMPISAILAIVACKFILRQRKKMKYKRIKDNIV